VLKSHGLLAVDIGPLQSAAIHLQMASEKQETMSSEGHSLQMAQSASSTLVGNPAFFGKTQLSSSISIKELVDEIGNYRPHSKII
jgi:hypothetical protein